MTLDDDVYLHFKLIEKINISNVVNDFLRNMMRTKVNNADEQKLLIEMEEVKQQEEELLQKKMILVARISRMKAEQEKAVKEDMKRFKFVAETVRNSGVMRDEMVNFK